jgi:hypothetical protein
MGNDSRISSRYFCESLQAVNDRRRYSHSTCWPLPATSAASAPSRTTYSQNDYDVWRIFWTKGRQRFRIWLKCCCARTGNVATTDMGGVGCCLRHRSSVWKVPSTHARDTCQQTTGLGTRLMKHYLYANKRPLGAFETGWAIYCLQLRHQLKEFGTMSG